MLTITCSVLIHPITHLISSNLVRQSDLTVCKQAFTTLYLWSRMFTGMFHLKALFLESVLIWVIFLAYDTAKVHKLCKSNPTYCCDRKQTKEINSPFLIPTRTDWNLILGNTQPQKVFTFNYITCFITVCIYWHWVFHAHISGLSPSSDEYAQYCFFVNFN